MTQIQALPQLIVNFEVATNEDWLDSIAFLNADGTPIVLAGIAFDMMVRPTAPASTILLAVSSSALIGGRLPNGTLTTGGASGNVLGINVPNAQIKRVGAVSNPAVYDLVARGDGISSRIMTGSVTFQQGVTR